MLVDISEIRKELNEEEKEIFDKVYKAMNAKKCYSKSVKLGILGDIIIRMLCISSSMDSYFAYWDKACNPCRKGR